MLPSLELITPVLIHSMISSDLHFKVVKLETCGVISLIHVADSVFRGVLFFPTNSQKISGIRWNSQKQNKQKS